ncbi:MAG: InlB B-repeat-containing protein [Desulfobacterales bacterium]|nr:InlB B-repeat-containing protein [Desulfobacterales bacterium]
MAAPTKVGHVFGGWYDNAEFTGGTITTIALQSTGDKTLYAKWTINQYIIVFDSNGGSGIARIIQDYNTAITAPRQSDANGIYLWSGWSQAIPSTMPAENLTITAQWTINHYAITFNSNGGSAVTAITQNYNSSITAPANPTRVGYTFNGWSQAVPSTIPAENLTLTAQWTINPYTITFNSNGGSQSPQSRKITIPRLPLPLTRPKQAISSTVGLKRCRRRCPR